MPSLAAYLLGGLVATSWASSTAPPPEVDDALQALPPQERDAAMAKRAWELGVDAYADGRLDDAIAHFLETYRYSKSPGPVFSLGQAHRHAYERDGDPRHRVLALKRYKQYLELAHDGARRLDAERYIVQLQAAVERDLEGLDLPAVFTGVHVLANVDSATVSVDGGPRRPIPLSPALPPGPHRIEIWAPGYKHWERQVDLTEGSGVTVSANLDPLPATLHVEGPAGASVYVDGRRVARLPLAAGVKLPAGRHEVGVAKAGKTLFVREVVLERGEEHRLDAVLPATGQRKVAIASLVLGTASSVSSIVLGSLALSAQAKAVAIADKRAQGSVPLAQELRGHEYQARRDQFRTAFIATGVTGLVLLITGVVLHTTDAPPVGSGLRRRAKLKPRGLRPGFAAGPGFTSLTLGGRW